MKFSKLLPALFLSFSILFIGCNHEDTNVEANINNKLKEQQDLSRVTATVVNGVATLSGEVKSEEDKNNAETLTKEVKGVNTVNNNITLGVESDDVHPSPGSVTGLNNDSRILDSARQIVKPYPGVDVTVSDGVITVTGTVNQDKKDAITGALKLLSNHGVVDRLQVK